mmetsp:Transcript_16222/g.50966  ORF Transcript_16222/g.50966 Transcript_16222/m.50966 type:complete len:465 (+) Transcript_16222:81-1475(+)
MSDDEAEKEVVEGVVAGEGAPAEADAAGEAEAEEDGGAGGGDGDAAGSGDEDGAGGDGDGDKDGGNEIDDLFEDSDDDEKRREKNEAPNPLGKAKKRKKGADEKKPKGKKAKAEGGGKTGDDFGGLLDSEDDDEPERTGADDAFIDDEGAAPAERDDSEDEDGPVGYHSEAEEMEEEEDLEKSLKAGKKKKKALSHSQTKEIVDNFLSRMEVAAESDNLANRSSKPAVNKLKMVKEMKDMLSKVHFQMDFLDQGVLGVLKAWLEPLPDGSLPNLNVRTAVLEVLQQLPVEMELEERREQLKKSGLGKVVMFLFKLPDETKPNRAMAKQLVEKWSRPIFELSTRYEDLRKMEETGEVSRKIMKSKEEGPAESSYLEDGSRKKALKPGDKGWRWHAAVPQKTPMDYVQRPTSIITAEEMKDRRREGKSERAAKLGRKLADIKKAKNATRQAEKLSVEGRGLVHYGN